MNFMGFVPASDNALNRSLGHTFYHAFDMSQLYFKANFKLGISISKSKLEAAFAS